MRILIVELTADLTSGVIILAAHRTVVPVKSARVAAVMMMVQLIVPRVAVKVARLLAALAVRRVCVRVSHRRGSIISGIIRMINGGTGAIVLVIRMDMVFILRVAIHLHSADSRRCPSLSSARENR